MTGETFANATARYRAGDREGALIAALALLDSASAEAAFALAALILFEAEQIDPLLRLAEGAVAKGLVTNHVLANLFDYCLVTDRLGALEAAVNLFPRTHPVWPLLVYFTGCARLCRGETGEALALFRLFRELAKAPSAQALIADPELNVYFRQGCLVATSDEVAACLGDPTPRPAALSDFTLGRRVKHDGAIYLSCADAIYIERFAGTMAGSLADRPVHLHVVNPQAETGAMLEALAATRAPGSLGWSFSADHHYGHAVAYACARFYAVPYLLDQYGARLILSDIDLIAQPGLRAIEHLPAIFDFACFRQARREPSSVFSCCVMVAEPNPAGRQFFKELGAFCLPALTLPLQLGWLIDQAALFSVLNHHRERRPDFRHLVLNDPLGTDLSGVMANVASDAEKHAMRFSLSRARMTERG